MASRLESSTSITVIHVPSNCLSYLRPPVASGNDFESFRLARVSKSWMEMAKVYNFFLESWVVGNEDKAKYLDNIVVDRAFCQRYVCVSGAVFRQCFSNWIAKRVDFLCIFDFRFEVHGADREDFGWLVVRKDCQKLKIFRFQDSFLNIKQSLIPLFREVSRSSS